MAADTYTPLLQLLLMGTGNDNNSWGDNHNTDVTSRVEQAIADTVTIVTTGGTYTLTENEARYNTVHITGTLASDLVIVVPDNNKIYHFINRTTPGAFFTVMKCLSNASAQSIPHAGHAVRITVISGAPFRGDSNTVGSYVFYAGTNTGDALECNGASYLRTQLPNLFSKIGTDYGAADALHFSLPDGYTLGKFLRSRTASVAVGTAQTNQNKSHTHTGSGTTAGVSVGHTHTGSGTTAGASVGHTHTGSGTTSGVSAGHTHTYSGTSQSMNANTSHTHSVNDGALKNVSAASGGGVGNLWSGNSVTTTGSTNVDHAHDYSGTTAAQSADHTHTYSFTTSGVSADHTHTYSFTSSAQSADHTHTYSFTTSTGSADGTEARPEALVGILCIRY